MKLTVINQVVESLLESDNPKAKIVANEAVIFWKTFFIAEQEGIDKAMEYFMGDHHENEYQEYRTSVIGANDVKQD